jgi:hypothetical protein
MKNLLNIILLAQIQQSRFPIPDYFHTFTTPRSFI